MTTVDFEAKCSSLGIDPDTYESAARKEFVFLSSLALDDDQEHFSEYKNFMTHDELIAIIRWNNLHKRFPQYFTWDGAVDDRATEGR